MKQLSNLLGRINSKILLKITLLVIIEIILIVGSFGVLAYFQSQQSSLGNPINIADKNRYLTSNLLLQTEKYLDGTSNASQLKTCKWITVKYYNPKTRRNAFRCTFKTSFLRLFGPLE